MLVAMCEMVMADGHMRRGCLVNWQGHARQGTLSRSGQDGIAYADIGWDGERTYRQLVVLVSFADCDFKWEDAWSAYDAMFNSPGYQQKDGAGCVADYFRDQSNGLFNLQFDVYGPYQVSRSVKTGSPKLNEGHEAFCEATQMLLEEHPDIDFSVYDWDGDGEVEQVVYVYAGYCGNQSSIKDEGYIWPTTGDFGTIETADGHAIRYYSASGELWVNDTPHGIGTICHEYSHCFLLPDLYPTSSSMVSDLSIVDEWDLMDGGTGINFGWCPPNYSPLEKMIMGWLTPKELVGDTVITGLKPLAEGGEAYLVQQDDKVFYLLENRQWTGWDYGLPGQGLVIYRVAYNKIYWQINSVNNFQDEPNYCLLAADGRTFTDWYTWLVESGATTLYNDRERRLHSKILSGAPYPWLSEDGTVDQVTLSEDKRITDITQNADGSVSFTFHDTNGNSIQHVKAEPTATGVYHLSGQKLRDNGQTEMLPRGIYIVNGRKIVKR